MKKTLLAGLVACALSSPALSANIVVNNVDVPNVGFNDPTPAVPVGGNGGTTVGAQRLIAYRKALELWGKTLASNVTIVVQGSFAGLTCDAGSATLAQAGALQIFANFPNAPLPNHWYGVALANAIAGADLTPGGPDPGPLAPPFADDIVANFNGNIGQANCLANSTWYYGLDSNPGAGQIDFLDTFMHEVAHGLGFQNFANEATGSVPDGLPDVYMANTLDLDRGMWNTFTSSAQIRASAVNTNRVVWAGPHVTANAPLVLGPYEGVEWVAGGVSHELLFGTASFGPPATPANFGGQVALGTDAVGVFTDACEPITANIAGKVALVDRGTCTFNVKVKNAQNAGATAVIVANTLGRGAFGLGGTDPTITIPSIGISNADGDAIKAALPNVTAGFFVDPSRRAGTTEGLVRLYAPQTVALGSSISHFDTSATPDLLMEPFASANTRANATVDLTPALMQDIGWGIETLKIGTCDTGVASVLATGQMLHANVSACADSAKNHGQFVSCMNGVLNAAKKAGLITGAQHGAITSCAAAFK
ncbi:MAG: PA domain-containing protein [Burkholderiales bacterium]